MKNVSIITAIEAFRASIEDSSIISTVAEGQRGIVIDTKAKAGERVLASVSRFVSFEHVEESADIQDESIETVLLLCGYTADGAGAQNTVPEKVEAPATRKSRKSKAAHTEEPSEEVKETKHEAEPEEKVVPAVEKAPAEVAATEEAPVEEAPAKEAPAEVVAEEKDAHSPTEEKATSPVEAEKAEPETEAEAEEAPVEELSVEDARAVIVTFRDTPDVMKQVNASKLKDFIGKPLGELFDTNRTYIKTFAMRAGTERSLVTEEVERAAQVLAVIPIR